MVTMADDHMLGQLAEYALSLWLRCTPSLACSLHLSQVLSLKEHGGSKWKQEHGVTREMVKSSGQSTRSSCFWVSSETGMPRQEATANTAASLAHSDSFLCVKGRE